MEREKPPFETAKFDLFFGFVSQDGGELELTLTYAEDLFTRGGAETLGRRLVALLRQVAAAPTLAPPAAPPSGCARPVPNLLRLPPPADPIVT